MKQRSWSKEDEDILRAEYPKGDLATAALRLGRTETAVRMRAKILGLRRPRRFHGNRNPNFAGYGRISKSYFSQVKRGASEKGLEMSVSLEYLDSITVDRCPFCGRALVYKNFSAGAEVTASLDRIDSRRGYIEGNLRWIHKDINIMRSNMTDAEFLGWVFDIWRYAHDQRV